MNITIKQALALADTLASDTPRLDAELLLAEAIQRTRTFLFARPEHRLSDAQLKLFQAYIARRREGEPIAYILGKKDFWSLELAVDCSTLIPRPETELLVELALEFIPVEEPVRVLDLGTGTGALALAIAKERAHARVLGIDQSADAVALAGRNAVANGIGNCQFVRSDWFAEVPGVFDLIVGNPPYIAEGDPDLDPATAAFEPPMALIAAQDGLADLQAIIETAASHLEPGGLLLLEHGWRQGPAVRQIFMEHAYIGIATWLDCGGRERVSGARRPETPTAQRR